MPRLKSLAIPTFVVALAASGPAAKAADDHKHDEKAPSGHHGEPDQVRFTIK